MRAGALDDPYEEEQQPDGGIFKKVLGKSRAEWQKNYHQAVYYQYPKVKLYRIEFMQDLYLAW